MENHVWKLWENHVTYTSNLTTSTLVDGEVPFIFFFLTVN